MHDKLFVYGSLMGDINSNISKFLHRNSRFLGDYQIQGQLYDVGFYPALVLTADKNRWITGHLFQLYNTPSTLFTLDDYEGIIIGQEDTSPYQRQLAEVYQQEKIEIAWIYTYNESVELLPLIPFSNYLDYLKINDVHQQFIQSV